MFHLLVYDGMLMASELAHPYKQIRFLPFEEKCQIQNMKLF